MNLKNLKLDDIEVVLFSEGWFFFVPYIGFYLCFKLFHLNASYLQSIFLGLHFLNIGLFIHYFQKVSRQNKLYNLSFWIIIILLFLIPGAYLEFPSDAWEHFRRIFAWQASTLVGDNTVNYKFTYFWGWTLMSKVQPLYRRAALDIYSAFWQFLLAYQFYLFAIRIGFSQSWAKVQVLGTICLFGTNLFSFYRYYALSSTPLAYIAYLQSLSVILDIFDGKSQKASALIFLIPLMYYNHYQELLLLIISTGAIFISKVYENLEPDLRKKFTHVVLFVLIISFTLGAFVVKHYQQYVTLLDSFWETYLQSYIKDKEVLFFNKDDTRYWSSWGILRIWDKNLPYFQTLGVHGYLSLIFSVIFWKKYRLLSTLTIAPLLILLFQPFTLFIASIEGHYTTFRILFAFPTSFMLIVGLKEIVELIVIQFKSYINTYWLILFVVILFSLQPNLPWRGRLWFQLYNPPAQLSLKNLDVTAQWFFENRKLQPKCYIDSDATTGFMLATHFALYPINHRLLVYNPSQLITPADNLESYINSYAKECALLVGVPAKMKLPPISKVGQLSGHWTPDLVRKDLDYNKDFVDATAFLNSLGWTKTFVPPFYWLYENPSFKNY